MKQSDSIGELALALSQLQGEIQDTVKSKDGYGYKYSDLHSVLDVARPLLAKHKLALSQILEDSGEGSVTCESILMHGSGQWISGRLSMPVTVGKGMTAAQAYGSASTYCRRYATAAIIGITQQDDDGSVGRTRQGTVEEKTITASQQAALQKLLDETQTDESKLCQHIANVNSLAQLPSSQAQRARKVLQDKAAKMATPTKEPAPEVTEDA